MSEQKLREALEYASAELEFAIAIVGQHYEKRAESMSVFLSEVRELLSQPTSDEGTPLTDALRKKFAAAAAMPNETDEEEDAQIAAYNAIGTDIWEHAENLERTLHARDREMFSCCRALTDLQAKYENRGLYLQDCEARVAALQSVSAAPQGFWVVEKFDDNGNGGMYWDGGGSTNFVADIHKAIHFCRHEDAFWARRSKGWGNNVRLTEHVYLPASPRGDGGEEFQNDDELLAYINRTPALLSLLYDIDLMPEQHPNRESREWEQIFAIANHWRERDIPTTPAATDGFVRVPRDLLFQAWNRLYNLCSFTYVEPCHETAANLKKLLDAAPQSGQIHTRERDGVFDGYGECPAPSSPPSKAEGET